MPTSPGYRLAPAYGVEKYIEVAGTGGGAKVTNDNLIITIWQTGAKLQEANLPIDFGDILVPLYAVDAGIEAVPEDRREAFKQGMHGRVGAQFQLWIFSFEDDWNGAYPGILAVLNPPQEIKQQLAGSVQYIGGTPAAGPGLPLPVENYNFLKPQMGQFSERFDIGGNIGPMSKVPAAFSEAPSIQWGAYVPLDFFTVGTGVDPGYIPLLKTNGADGVAPVPFDMATEAGVLECIAAVNKGNFFIPAIMPVETSGAFPSYYEINWPHSITRG